MYASILGIWHERKFARQIVLGIDFLFKKSIDFLKRFIS